jgi:hypothetical protein
MERSYNLAGLVEMLIEGFGAFDRLIEESVAKAIRL